MKKTVDSFWAALKDWLDTRQETEGGKNTLSRDELYNMALVCVSFGSAIKDYERLGHNCSVYGAVRALLDRETPEGFHEGELAQLGAKAKTYH